MDQAADPDRTNPTSVRAVLSRAVHPPVLDWRFWAVQAMVVALAAAHLAVDVAVSTRSEAIPAGIPVALLLVPVGYAALRYGLSGSAATGAWATLLWLPDLLLPHDRGHVGNDAIELALVDAVAVFVGHRIEVEHLATARVERARARHLAAEARYRQLFETNSAPILVADEAGLVREANPAARAVLPEPPVGRSVGEVVGRTLAELKEHPPEPLTLPDGRDYRVSIARAEPPSEAALVQLVLEDVTEEREEGRRARRSAGLLLAAQEEERRRVARELHDEPLQLLVELARRLEALTTLPDLPPRAAAGLVAARGEAVETVRRLRRAAAGLRPPALEELGIVPAVRGLLADVEDRSCLRTELRVDGSAERLAPHVELGVFRIVQEAVTNAVRHANAHRVVVTLAFRADRLLVEVADDGTGFDAPALEESPPARHLGLLGMRERAALLGGELRVRSEPGGPGTVVEATIPLPASLRSRSR
jgi:signal transduction histidine kinase